MNFVERIDMTIAHDVEVDRIDSSLRAGVRFRRAATVLAAIAGALLVWLVADPLAGVDLTVGTGASARTIGPGVVVLVSALAGLGSVGLALLPARPPARAPP